MFAHTVNKTVEKFHLIPAPKSIYIVRVRTHSIQSELFDIFFAFSQIFVFILSHSISIKTIFVRKNCKEKQMHDRISESNTSTIRMLSKANNGANNSNTSFKKENVCTAKIHRQAGA